MLSWCIRVHTSEAECIRKKLLRFGVLDRTLRVVRVGDMVIFPLTPEKLDKIPVDLRDRIDRFDFDEREGRKGDYRKYLTFHESLISLLPRSFDIIGDIAVIKLPSELLRYRTEIGEAMMRAHPNVKSVVLDRGIKGGMRIMDLEIIAGEERTETVHTEYGLRFMLDLRKAYFNPRLATERKRIATLTNPKEIVIDMFAGVGPYSIAIGKFAKPRTLYAIDINPDAIHYLMKNVALNAISKVVPICEDARKAIRDLPMADRIVMNLPHSAMEFISDALSKLELMGTLHTYFIAERIENNKTAEAILNKCHHDGYRTEILRCEELKTYSPSM
ncbi:MAG: class I SAM-dependent methyltransferase family protein, partial [Methanomassiliicoccales archaeon]